MSGLLLTRTTLVWLLLVGATGLSFALGHGAGFDDLRRAGMAILAVAFLKVRFVILEFMEVGHAPVFMRVLAEVWVLIACAVLVVLFLRPM